MRFHTLTGIGATVASIACGRVGFDAVALAEDAGDTPIVDFCGIDNRPPSAPACAAVEAQILAGNIAAVGDADLIAWAQNGCMKKPAPAIATMPVTSRFALALGTGADCASGAPPGSSGTSPNYVYDGTGELNLGTFSGTCGETNLRGTYSVVRFANLRSNQPVSTHYDGCRVIHAGTIDGTAIVRAHDYASAASSPYPLVLLAGELAARSAVQGGSAADVVIVASASGGNEIQTGAGDDTVMLGGGLFADDNSDTFLRLGDGDDVAYIAELGLLPNSPEMDVYAGAGNDRIYFNRFIVEDIEAEAGDDVISCTGLFGNASCTSYGNWAGIRGGAGNDIISIDGPLIQTSTTGGATDLDGGAGFNIIYVATIDNTDANDGVSIRLTATGSSLLVLGGDHATATPTTVNAIGTGNVLLLKTGASSTGFTFSGFTRSLPY